MGICLCLLLSRPLLAQVSLQAHDFDQAQWIDPDRSFSVRMSHVANDSGNRMAFFIGSLDVTALMQETAPGVFRYRASLLPLPPGEQTLTVYLVRRGNQWEQLASLRLSVLSEGGFEESSVTPRLDLSSQTQAMQDQSDQNPAATTRMKNLALQAGLETRQLRSGVEIQTSWNITGSSEREQALRFAERGTEAPKVDLSDYLVEVSKHTSRLQLGHVSFGSHPLLMSGVANRGLNAAWRAFDTLDVSFTAQNGQSITGASNVLGLSEYSTNRINGLSVGSDLLDGNDGQLRIDFTYLDAKITAEDNFNIGEVTDAQKSHGVGVVLSGNTASGRLRGNIAWARSTFTNPEDPFLEQDLTVVKSTETTDSAYSLRLEYDVLVPDYQQAVPWSLTVTMTHSLTDPFYSSVGAFITPDTINDGLSLNGQAGQINWQLQHSRMRDNIDDIPTILTTLTRNTVLSASVPVKTLSNSDSDWLPQNLNLGYQRNHQFGGSLPPSFDPDTHIPDQLNRQQSLGLQWQTGTSSVSWNFTRSDQDNRQQGRENADFVIREHSLSVNTSLSESLNINLSVTHSKADDIEQSLQRRSTGVSIGIDWNINQRLSVSANLSDTTEDDSQNLVSNESGSNQIQLSYRLHLPDGAGGKLPLQAFVRYSDNDNINIDNQFQFQSSNENRTLTAGLNLSLF